MTTVSKFYFHDAVTTVSGTLPGASTLSVTASSVAVTGSGTNRAMDGSLGAGQVSQAWTTLANTSAQPTFIRRFISDPIGVNTFGVDPLASISWFWSGSESNTNSNFYAHAKVWLWRPSTGAIVATLYDAPPPGVSEFSTSQSGLAAGGTSGAGALASATSADGDVVVVEWWRSTTTQSMGTAYTNTVFYDGTQDAAMTSNAGSYFTFANAAGLVQPVEMSSGVPAATSMPPQRRDRGFRALLTR